MMELIHKSLLLTALVCLVTCLPQAPVNCLLDVPTKELNGVPKVDAPEVNVDVPRIQDVPGIENLNVIPKVDTPDVNVEVPAIQDVPVKENLNVIPKVDTPEVNVEVPAIKAVPGTENLNVIPKVDTPAVNVEVPAIKDVPGTETLNVIPKVDTPAVPAIKVSDVPAKETLNGTPKVDATGVKKVLPGIKAKENLKRIPKADIKQVKRALPGIKAILKTLIGKPSLPKVDSPSLPKVDSPSLPKVDSPSLPKVDSPSLPKVDSPSLPKVDTDVKGLAEKKSSWLGLGIPGAPAIPDVKLVDLQRRVKKLESVLTLLGFIQVVKDKMIVSSGKDEEIETSNSSCQAIGGRIVVPMNEAENNAILYFLKKYNRYAYLNLREGPISSIFHYPSGFPALFTRWRKNEPSGKGQERCVEMYTDGQWNDKGCNQKRLTVCEL